MAGMSARNTWMLPLLACGLLCCPALAGALKGVSSTSSSLSCLAPETLQTASSLTGQEDGTGGILPGQKESEVDDANFINFCSGHELTNGRQIAAGSCNGIPMGMIPAATNMISAIIVHPQPGEEIIANVPFNISVQTRHLRAGYQANPSASYYTAPQNIDENGDIIGHCHVTIQNIGSLSTAVAPDPQDFAYFTVLNDEGDGNGLLGTELAEGLPVGAYRICTMIVSRNHQPVVMPVGQRGAQDDCTKFRVLDAQAAQN